VTRGQRNHGQHARHLFQHEALLRRIAMVAVIQQRIIGVGVGCLLGAMLGATIQQALRNGGVDVGRAPAQQFHRGIEPDRNEHHHGQPNVVVGHNDNVRSVHRNTRNMQAAAAPFGHTGQSDGVLLVVGNVEPHGLAARLVQLRAQAVIIHIDERGTGVHRAHQGRRMHDR